MYKLKRRLATTAPVVAYAILIVVIGVFCFNVSRTVAVSREVYRAALPFTKLMNSAGLWGGPHLQLLKQDEPIISILTIDGVIESPSGRIVPRMEALLTHFMRSEVVVPVAFVAVMHMMATRAFVRRARWPRISDVKPAFNLRVVVMTFAAQIILVSLAFPLSYMFTSVYWQGIESNRVVLWIDHTAPAVSASLIGLTLATTSILAWLIRRFAMTDPVTAHCPSCGYSLLPPATCPECGVSVVINAKAPASLWCLPGVPTRRSSRIAMLLIWAVSLALIFAPLLLGVLRGIGLL